MRRREELKKFSLSWNVQLHLKFSGKKYWSADNFEQFQVRALLYDRTDTNFIAPLRIHF